MPSNKPTFLLRTEQEIIDKLKYIAEKENRTATKQLEYILKCYIEEWESKHERTELKSKLLESKIG